MSRSATTWECGIDVAITGIKGLTALINENAPDAIKAVKIETLFGRKVAIDAYVPASFLHRDDETEAFLGQIHVDLSIPHCGTTAGWESAHEREWRRDEVSIVSLRALRRY